MSNPLWKLRAHPAHLVIMREAVSAAAAGEDSDMRRAAQKCEDALDYAVNPQQVWPEPCYAPPEIRPAQTARLVAEVPGLIVNPDLVVEVTLSPKGLEHLKKAVQQFRRQDRTSSSKILDAALVDIEAAQPC